MTFRKWKAFQFHEGDYWNIAVPESKALEVENQRERVKIVIVFKVLKAKKVKKKFNCIQPISEKVQAYTASYTQPLANIISMLLIDENSSVIFRKQ